MRLPPSEPPARDGRRLSRINVVNLFGNFQSHPPISRLTFSLFPDIGMPDYSFHIDLSWDCRVPTGRSCRFSFFLQIGSQDTSNPLVLILKSKEIQISLNEKGRCLDNIWLERLWRSVKREDIYLREYRGGNELYQGVHKYFHHYNFQRSLQVLSSQTPSDIFRPNAMW